MRKHMLTALHENTDSDQNALSNDTFSRDKCNIVSIKQYISTVRDFKMAGIIPKKKRQRLGPRFQMEINFSDEGQKKGFLNHLDNARHSLSAGSSRAVDNYKLLSTLLDHFDQDCVDVNDEAPSTSSRKKPLLKHSGIIVI